ncbi:methyltransferase [Streptomyces sp. ERV7]|uniref:class I SAM-dependent methyltransferase n=1 Tax=Streptomyces sp. ERV7 TaxID=1322334 RepID=UPI0007F4900D|nr:methyltransferase domain-containing protein [Streptomyces sp. ERV7]OAR22708.1 methyltransferase [Streptomyces sp. ERV7]
MEGGHTGAERRFDIWAAGTAYERYMGRWSRTVAERFVAWLDRPDGLRWLDVGCGTGALTATVAARCGPAALLGVDRSAGFAASARGLLAALHAPGDAARARFAVADARALPVPDASCDVAVSGLVLNFLPGPASAVAEAVRVVRPGGTVAAYVWDYADGMRLLRHFWDTALALDPAAATLHEGRRFPLCRPDPLRELWRGAGLVDVAVDGIGVDTVFTGFADLWEPFLSGQGPAPGYVAALTPAARDRLRTALRQAVPTRPDGSIALTARAWAVRGRRPAGDAAVQL